MPNAKRSAARWASPIARCSVISATRSRTILGSAGEGPGDQELPQGLRRRRADYNEALQRHYRDGPLPDWAQNFVTAYASAHPWEDFAETFAHYLHIVDTLETARDFGIRDSPSGGEEFGLAASINFDAYEAKLDELIGSWLPLTFAVNSINRSMGLNDLYRSSCRRRRW